MAHAPVIDLDALLHDYLLGLVLIAGGSQETGSRPVQWVHSSDLLDPSPFLMPRTVLLTTGAQFDSASDTAEFEDYVARLIEVGVTALGLGVGLRWERIPPALIAVCDRLRLPLFRVPYDTPFLAVVRTAARLIEASSALHWGREQTLPPGFRSRNERLAAVERALRATVLQLFIEGRQALAEQAAADTLPALPRGTLIALSFDRGLTSQHPRFGSEFDSFVADRAGIIAAVQGEHMTLIAETSKQADLRRLFAKHAVPAGISERGTSTELPELVEQARRAAELARKQHPEPGLLDYRPAMHAGVLQVLQGSPEAMRRAHGLLAPLRQHDLRHRDAIERSLATWLAHNGQTSPAAAELGVHRHTLRHRMQTAESLLQRDLDDPDTRNELWAAFRLLG